MIKRKEKSQKQPQNDLPDKGTERRVKNKCKGLIVWTLLVLALVICVFVISQVLSKGYISVGGYSMFRVATGSMEPTLPVGSLLISQSTDIRDIQKGDIVNFYSRENGMIDMVITHRVIDIHRDTAGNVYLETQGDNNKYADGYYVDAQNLIGKVVFHTGQGNFFAGIIHFLSSPMGFLVCIVFPCLAVGVMIMRDTVGTMKKEIDSIKKEMDQPQKPEKPEKASLEQQMGTEAYEAYCEKLRNELLEELKQSAAQVHTENQLDSQQQQ